MSEHGPITVHAAIELATIVNVAIHGERVAWLADGEDGRPDNRGAVMYGTARSIGDERGNFAQDGEDIRDAHLRITTAEGWEWFPAVADVLRWYGAGLFVVGPA